MDNNLYFTGDDGEHGIELWRSDGTEDGTYLVKDINPGSDQSNIAELTPIGDRLFFRANNGTSGDEFFISDGTADGTVMVSDIYFGGYSSNPKDFTKVGNHIVFSAAASHNDRELRSFDPTEILYHSIEGMRWSITPSLPEGLSLNSATGEITGIPTEVIDWTDYTVTLTANDPQGDTYFYNGNGSTWMVKDVWPGTSSGTCCSSSNSPFAISYDNNLYFEAEDGTHGFELWKSDGTSGGTVMVKDIYPGSEDSDVDLFTVMGDTLYFIANDGNGSTNVELWRTDGTEDGTYMVKDIRDGYSGSSPGPLQYGIYSMAIMDDNLYFHANDGVHGVELWKSDGTEAGTVMVKDINSGYSSSGAGSTGITVIGNTLYFQANDGTNGAELWKSDGTADGTVMVKDIRSGSSGSGIMYLTAVGNTLYFRANDGTHGAELWKSDGTEAGTVMVKDIWSGTSSGSPCLLYTSDAADE